MNLKILSKKEGVFILALILITFIVYSPSMSGRLFFDDEYFILRNVHVHELGNIPQLFVSSAGAGAGHFGTFYRPVQFVFHALVYSTFGENPFAHHALSILLHIGVGILFFYLLRDFRISDKISFFSALLFLIHSVNTQAVSYISGLGEPLGLFFLLSAIMIYRKKEILYKKIGKFPVYLFFTLTLIFSFLSKERSLIFLGLFLIIDLAYPSKDKNSLIKNFKKSLKENKSYYLIIVLTTLFYWIATITFLNFGQKSFSSSSAIYNESILVRFYSFLYSFSEYLIVIFFPKTLYSERAFVVMESFLNTKVIVSFLLICFFAFFSIYKFKTQRHLFFGFFWFIIALFPTSGIIIMFYTMKEHWIYYSMLGFCFVFTFYFFETIKNKKIALTIFIVLLVLLGARSFERNSEWSDPETFFQNELKYNPYSENAIANLAYEYYKKGEIDKAIKLYEKGINVTNSIQLAMMYHNLGYMNYLKGDVEKAVELYHKSLEINPYYYYALQELSKYYYEKRDEENFKIYYTRLLEIEKNIYLN